MKSERTYSIRLTKRIEARVEPFKERLKMSISELINEALLEWVEKHQPELDRLSD